MTDLYLSSFLIRSCVNGKGYEHKKLSVNKQAIYRLGIISLAHAPVHVTDIPVVNVHVDELSSAKRKAR
jgi:hypothetical protein